MFIAALMALRSSFTSEALRFVVCAAARGPCVAEALPAFRKQPSTIRRPDAHMYAVPGSFVARAWRSPGRTQARSARCAAAASLLLHPLRPENLFQAQTDPPRHPTANRSAGSRTPVLRIRESSEFPAGQARKAGAGREP